MHKGKILILEDDKDIAKIYCNLLENKYLVKLSHSSDEFFKIYNVFEPEVVILDIRLNNSPLNGVEVFEKLKSEKLQIPNVIILSGEASRKEIAQTMKMGAYTFIEKTGDFNVEKFLIDIKQAINQKLQEKSYISLQQDKENLRKSLIDNNVLIGKSNKMKHVKKLITKFAEADVDILLLGDTGTGKEIIANHIYWNSKRVGKPFEKINAGCIPESLVHSELFGHKKGSFTGAVDNKMGVFEKADKGILFLDEISNLNYQIQAKILRTIENREIQILGGDKKNLDIKFIFASNKNLKKLIEKQEFREDLFYRLEGNIIHIPPLVERDNDVILLMDYFFKVYSEEHNTRMDYGLSIIKSDLLNYQWPGNVRELQKFCEFISIMYEIVTNEVILEELKRKNGNAETKTKKNELLMISDYVNALDYFSKSYISFQLKKYNYNIPITAKNIGIERSTLYKKIKKYDIHM